MEDKPVSYNILEEEILELYAKGLNKEMIAIQLDIPLSTVNRIFAKPNVKEKIEEIIEMRELLLREKHTKILEDITSAMLEKADGDLLKIVNSNKDILDVIALADKITKEQEKKRLGTSDGNVLINILNQLSGNEEDK